MKLENLVRSLLGLIFLEFYTYVNGYDDLIAQAKYFMVIPVLFWGIYDLFQEEEDD